MKNVSCNYKVSRKIVSVLFNNVKVITRQVKLCNNEHLFFFFFSMAAITLVLKTVAVISEYVDCVSGCFVFREKSVNESDVPIFIGAIHHFNTLSITLFMRARKARQAEGLGKGKKKKKKASLSARDWGFEL